MKNSLMISPSLQELSSPILFFFFFFFTFFLVLFVFICIEGLLFSSFFVRNAGLLRGKTRAAVEENIYFLSFFVLVSVHSSLGKSCLDEMATGPSRGC